MRKRGIEKVMEDKVYVTILGDTWDSIAYKLYGDSKRYDELLEFNQENRDTLIFNAGTLIKYKETPISITNNLPPWRK